MASFNIVTLEYLYSDVKFLREKALTGNLSIMQFLVCLNEKRTEFLKYWKITQSKKDKIFEELEGHPV